LTAPGTPRLADAFERAARQKPSAIRPGTFARLWRLPVGALAVAVLVLTRIGEMHIGRLRFRTGIRPFVRSFTYEARFHAGRSWRIARKRVVERPVRHARRVVQSTRRSAPVLSERGVKQVRRAMSGRGRRRASRALRRRTRQAARTTVRGLRRLRRALRWPAARAMRLFRQARYFAGTRLRGDGWRS
jgi:hypothetical protein